MSVSPEALRDLANRCESEQPSRALNIAIRDAVNCSFTPHYTTSLDAAVTLVPADAWRETNGPRKYLNIPSQSPNYWQCIVTIWDLKTDDFIGWGATEPMAICSAALRARAALAKECSAAADTRSDSTTESEG